MIAADEDALKCDLAEEYHIYDYRSLPVDMAAAFSAGLRYDSRIKMKLRGDKLPPDIVLLALIHDRLTDIAWSLSGSEEKPEHIADLLIRGREEKNSIGFDSAEEYERAREWILKGE